MAAVLIGTSGFDYPHWRNGTFYPAGLPRARQLPYYAEHFNTVELNAPFYGLPSPERFAWWKSLTPPDFRFAVKASRYITHIRQLRECEAPLQLFMERVGHLGSRLSAVLFQLPPTLQRNLERLRRFLGELPEGPHWIVEFRHPSWLVEPVYDLLRAQRVALCIPVGGTAGVTADVITGPAIYLRMHRGRGREGNFTPAELRHWADWIRSKGGNGTVYVYFNNDWQGFAVRNALSLRRMLGIDR